MIISVLRTQLSETVRRPGRLLLTGFSVLVASFVVFGTVLAYQIVSRTTLDTFSDTPRGVSLVVATGSGTTLTPRQTAAIRHTPGVRQAVGRATVTFGVGDPASGTSLDVIADPGGGPLSRIVLVSGTYPGNKREIALDRRSADRLGAGPGSTLRLRSDADGTAPVKVTVTGVVDGARSAGERAYAPDFTVAALGSLPGFARLDILAAPGADQQALMGRVAAVFAGDTDATFDVTGGDAVRVAEAKAAVRQYDQIFALVTMFVAIAVVAAALVATSTFRIVFAQRLRQLALLRAIGARRGQLVTALAVEGAVTGLLTSAAGVLLAGVAGLAAPAFAAATGRTLSAPGIPVAAGVAVVIGAGLLTVGAVLAPAFSAAGVPPIQALRDAGTVAAERTISAGRLLLGLLLASGTAGCTWLTVTGLPERGQTGHRSSDALLYLVGAGALAFGTLIALGPVLIRPVLAVVGRPLHHLGPIGKLAVTGIGGTPRRAAAVSVVVALGVALVAGTIVGTTSLQQWTDQKLAARNPADLAMFAEAEPISGAVLTRLRADARLTHVTPMRITTFTTAEGVTYGAIDIDMTALPALTSLQARGSVAKLAPGKAILGRGLAEDLGADIGDEITLRAERGRTVRVEIVAILIGDAPLQTHAVLAPADLTRLGASTTPTGVLADIADGSHNDAVTAFRRIGGEIGAEVAVLADARVEADGELASLLATALGLLALTVLIAVVGVGTTTGLSVLERQHEIGLLRALGLSRRRLRAMIGIEAGLYGLIGAVLGIALGVPLAWLALEALNLDLPLTFPAMPLSLIVLTLGVITVAAGLIPARRAARADPNAAMASADS